MYVAVSNQSLRNQEMHLDTAAGGMHKHQGDSSAVQF